VKFDLQAIQTSDLLSGSSTPGLGLRTNWAFLPLPWQGEPCSALILSVDSCRTAFCSPKNCKARGVRNRFVAFEWFGPRMDVRKAERLQNYCNRVVYLEVP